MSKSKKVTYEMLMTNANVDNEPVEVAISDELTLSVKKRLGLADALDFVRVCGEACFGDDGEYAPEVFEYACDLEVMEKYAGIAAPKDFQKAYDLLYGSDIMDKVMDVIDRRQLMMLIDSAKKRIENRLSVEAHAAAGKVQELIGAVGNLVDESQSVMNSLSDKEFVGKLNELAEMAQRGGVM